MFSQLPNNHKTNDLPDIITRCSSEQAISFLDVASSQRPTRVSLVIFVPTVSCQYSFTLCQHSITKVNGKDKQAHTLLRYDVRSINISLHHSGQAVTDFLIKVSGSPRSMIVCVWTCLGDSQTVMHVARHFTIVTTAIISRHRVSLERAQLQANAALRSTSLSQSGSVGSSRAFAGRVSVTHQQP